jgi:hypothetical protein
MGGITECARVVSRDAKLQRFFEATSFRIAHQQLQKLGRFLLKIFLVIFETM